MLLREFNIPSTQIKINPDKLSILMGINENPLPEPYNELIENEIRQLSDYPDLKGGYCLVEIINIDPGKSDFLANEIEFHAGKQVTRYLKNSETLAFFICTAGETINTRSKELMNEG
ncbi:MAG: hypothetical protein ACP5E3_14315, partial [Bacteroidales bacterium]